MLRVLEQHIYVLFTEQLFPLFEVDFVSLADPRTLGTMLVYFLF